MVNHEVLVSCHRLGEKLWPNPRIKPIQLFSEFILKGDFVFDELLCLCDFIRWIFFLICQRNFVLLLKPLLFIGEGNEHSQCALAFLLVVLKISVV